MTAKVMGRPRTPFDMDRYDEIVGLRLKLGISKYRCAAMINVSNAAYSQYELQKDNFIGVAKQEELLRMLRELANRQQV